MAQRTTQPGENPGAEARDAIHSVLRDGARQLIHQAVEAELAAFLADYEHVTDVHGRRCVVRNGYQPEREVLTGVGPVTVQTPKTRDRSGSGIRFTSSVLPPYLRKTREVAEVLPWLYLKGISAGDFNEALAALFGGEVEGLSVSTISRLKGQWADELEAWRHRDLSDRRYVYWWADGVHFNIRGEDERACLLVIVGVREDGVKEFVAIEDGYREDAQSWREVLVDLKHRGLTEGPELAIGDGALGFWKALAQEYGATRAQRCWVHKTANVLSKLPQSAQPKAKERLHRVWQAPTRDEAHAAFDAFVAGYEAKYPKAADCLRKDRDELLAFYDFPAEHWQHLRTTNPIESTFATVELRAHKTRGCVSRQTLLSLVYKLGQSAQKRWRRLRGFRKLPDVTAGIEYIDGVRADQVNQDRSAA